MPRGFFYELGRLSGGSGAMHVALAGALVLVFLLWPVLGTTAVVGVLLLVLAVAAVVDSVIIVDAYEKRALTVFGENRGLLDPGIHFVPPFVSQTYQFDLRTQMIDVSRQEAITEDNSPVTADAFVFVRVVDAERAFLEIEDYREAVSNLAQTTLRAVIGDMALDDTLSRRDVINERIHEELDEPTDAWGIRVESVEVSEVLPSETVKNAMEQQSSAERKRRAMILEAQGERQSAIERATGEKQADIIRAQGSKQSQVLSAQGDAVATVLRARAAESMGERAILEKGMESLEAIGQSPSTTFVLPQELTSLLGRYSKHLTGSDVAKAGAGEEAGSLESRGFDEETRELLGIDDIAELAAGEGIPDADAGEIEVEDLDEPKS